MPPIHLLRRCFFIHRVSRLGFPPASWACMVEEEAYCVEILTQISSIVSASEKVALILLEDHVEHCVREAIEAEEKVAELAAAGERFLRV